MYNEKVFPAGLSIGQRRERAAVGQLVRFHAKSDEFRTKNDGFRTNSDGFCTKNDEFRTENDEIYSAGASTLHSGRTRRAWTVRGTQQAARLVKIKIV